MISPILIISDVTAYVGRHMSSFSRLPVLAPGMQQKLLCEHWICLKGAASVRHVIAFSKCQGQHLEWLWAYFILFRSGYHNLKMRFFEAKDISPHYSQFSKSQHLGKCCQASINLKHPVRVNSVCWPLQNITTVIIYIIIIWLYYCIYVKRHRL